MCSNKINFSKICENCEFKKKKHFKLNQNKFKNEKYNYNETINNCLEYICFNGLTFKSSF